MKRRIISLLLVFCMVLSLLPTAALATGESEASAAEPVSPFADVKAEDWFYKAVQYVKANGIFNGTDAKNFSPDGTMTRAMFVTVLGRMAGIDPADYAGETGFPDVPQNAWYAPYVKWAAQFGITGGTGDGNFSPDAEIDRAQMAVLFVRYFEAFGVKYETDANITTVPADLSSVPDWAKDAVLKLWAQGLLNGDGVNFDPSGSATRAQVATLCTRVDGSVETWYSEPGVPSERERIDPDETAQQPEQDKTPTGGSSSGSSTGGSSSGGSSGGGTSTTTYYEVNFALGDGQADITLPAKQTVVKGTDISALATPAKAGVIFLGWYYDAALNNPAASSDTIDKNLTLYAKTAAGDEVQSVETPNYITRTDVDAGAFTFSVVKENGTVSKDDIKFIHVTGGNIDVAFELENGKVTATLEAGQTYQVELLNDSVTFTGEGEAVRYLNILTAKEEATSAKLNESVGQLSLGDIRGLDEDAFNGLFIMDETNAVAENDTTGTFTYSGDLNIGDTVAITSEGVDLTDVTSTDGDVAYLKITGKSGSSAPYTYTYEMAEVEDVLFMPDVLPIESTWDTDGDTTNNSITISATNLATAMSNVDAASLDKGDYLGFLADGETYSDDMDAEMTYGEITGYTISGDCYIITYELADEEDIENALDVYYEQDREVTLTKEEQAQIKEDIKVDVQNSGYAEQAAVYLAAVMLESNDLTTVPDAAAVEARMNEIEPYLVVNSTSVQMADGKKVVSVDFDPSQINVTLLLNSKLDKLEGKGFRVSIEVPFTVTIGSGDNKVEIEIKATFEEEIILKQKISTSRHKLGFLKYDYSLNASFEVGNYTGIGFTADVKSGSDGDDESLTKRLDAIMDRMEAYHESGSISATDGTMDSLAEIYQEVMDNANDTWIDIVDVKLFETNGNAFLHIFCWQVRGSFVVSANLAVSMGMSFDYITQKQYNFSVRVKSRTSTNETIDIITPQYNFDFYVVGTIGIRAGIRLEMYVGLFSLKLDKIGITAEAGAYARLWGYFFYHLNWKENEGKTESSAGAMLIEIGIYLDIKFVAQLLSSDRLTWAPTIYAHEWPLWSAGERQNVYAFAESIAGSDTYTLAAVKTLKLPTSTFDMLYMDLKDGTQGTVNRDSNESGTDEKYFLITFSNPNFSYDAATNTVTVGNTANAGGEETDMTITWKKAALSFTSKPIQKTIHIKWSDPANVRYINFDSDGGSAVTQLTAGSGGTINWPEAPKKQGYVFDGWYTDSACTKAYTGSTATMPEFSSGKGMTLYAKWTPATNTPYTVETYTEELNGSYTLTTETLCGTTDAETTVKANTPVGFTARSITQQTIAADGSTVVKVYYDRNNYTLTFKSGYADGEEDITRTYKHGATLAVPTFAREGYTFDGWDKSFEVNDDGDYIATENATYTAQWTAKDNIITFVSDGSEVETKTVKTDAKITDKPTPTKTGHTFGGWYTDPSCVKAWNFGSDTVSGPMTLYAKWAADTYTVSFDVNYEGSTNPTSMSVTYGQTYGTLPTPTRTGYGFGGWFTAKDGGDEVTATTEVTTAADGQTLYAHWKAGTFTVIFEANYAGGTNPTSVSATFGQPYGDLPALERSGYTFNGWFTAKTNGTEVKGTDTVAITDNQTLYAHWTANTNTQYTVKHYQQNLNDSGYTEVESDRQTLTGTTDTDTAAVAKDYTGFTVQSFQQQNIDGDGSTVIEIYYGRNKYTIHYWIGDLENAAGNPTEYIYGQTITLQPLTRTGYTFGGWFTDSACSEGNEVTEISATQTGEVDLYDKWTENQYKLTWELNGGDKLAGNYTSGDVYYNDQIIAPYPTRKGYDFVGWDHEVPRDMPDRDLTFVAQWTPAKYNIRYELDGGTNGANPATYTYGVGVSSFADPSRTGYTFNGWFTEEAGGDKVTGISTTDTGSNTLYAHWTANTHTVTFDPNGGTLSGESAITVTYDSTYGTLPTPAHSDATARFQGWFTAESGGTQVTAETVVSLDENETLCAQWSFGSVEYSNVRINGESIYAYADGKVDGYADGSVKFDASTNTLTLTNATITGSGLEFEKMTVDGKTIYPTIKLVGTNTVTATKAVNQWNAYAVYIDITSENEGNLAKVAFTGNGTLIATVTEDAMSGESIARVAAVYGYVGSVYDSVYGKIYITDGAVIEATVPDVSGDGMKVAGVMAGSYNGNGYIRLFFDTSLTAKGGTRAIFAKNVQGTNYATIPATVSANYDGSDPQTITGGDQASSYDYSGYKYYTATVAPLS